MKPSHAANYLAALAQSLPAVFTTTAAMLVSLEQAQKRNALMLVPSASPDFTDVEEDEEPG